MRPRRPAKITAALTLITLSAMLLSACGSSTKAQTASSGSAGSDSPTTATSASSAPNKDLSPISMKIGYTPDPGGAPLLAIAQKMGYFAQEKINPTLLPFNTGPLQVQAMGAGDLAAGWIGPGAVWLPATGHAKAISLNLVDLSDVVLARPGSGIKTVADLKGKSIADPTGTSGDMLLRLALQHANVPLTDVKMLNMAPATAVSAFMSGSVQAIAIWRAAASAVFAKYPNVTVVAQDSDYYPNYVAVGAYVVSNSVADNHPDWVVRLDKVLQLANDYRYDHPDETLAITAAFLKVPPQQIAPIFKYVKYWKTSTLVQYSKDGTVGKWLDDRANFFVSIGTIKSAQPASSYYMAKEYIQAATAQP